MHFKVCDVLFEIDLMIILFFLFSLVVMVFISYYFFFYSIHQVLFLFTFLLAFSIFHYLKIVLFSFYVILLCKVIRLHHQLSIFFYLASFLQYFFHFLHHQHQNQNQNYLKLTIQLLLQYKNLNHHQQTILLIILLHLHHQEKMHQIHSLTIYYLDLHEYLFFLNRILLRLNFPKNHLRLLEPLLFKSKHSFFVLY